MTGRRFGTVRISRWVGKPPAAWEAYEYYLRGSEAYFLQVNRRTNASLCDARRFSNSAERSTRITRAPRRSCPLSRQRRRNTGTLPKAQKRLEGLFTVTTRSLNQVQSLRSMRPGKSPAAMLGEAECASGKPGERRRHLRYPRRSRPLPHFDAFASAAFSAARAPARMLAMA